MNCISGLGAQPLPSALARKHPWALVLSVIAITACGVKSSESADDLPTQEYSAHYLVHVDPAESSVQVTLEIRQSRNLLREVSFPSLSSTFSAFSGDGDVQVRDGVLRWLPPAKGGKLQWRVLVAHERGKNAYDARLGPDWGVLRAEDIIPRAKSRSLKGSTSNTTLSFDLPPGWSAVTEYSSINDPILISRPDRRFDQPTGWMALGDIGVRRETIAGVRVAIAGPQGHAVRRMDMLALLNWILPELTALLPEPLTRLTIVSAGDPMWRGGLSAPSSLYIHADRPLISENATSTLVHELIHTALSIRGSQDADWIAEGLAEYYSLELLKRGGAISVSRHATAISGQARWAEEADALCGPASTGATTALAVTVFRALDQEIRDKTAAAKNLDDLLHEVAALKVPVSLSELRNIATELIGDSPDALHSDKLPGCPKMAPGNNGN